MDAHEAGVIDLWMLTAAMQQPESAPKIDLRGWLAAALLVAPFVLGWLVGVCVFVVLWFAAAVVAGYKAGRGADDDGNAE